MKGKDIIYLPGLSLWSGLRRKERISSLRQGDRWGSCCSLQMGEPTLEDQEGKGAQDYWRETG